MFVGAVRMRLVRVVSVACMRLVGMVSVRVVRMRLVRVVRVGKGPREYGGLRSLNVCGY